MTDKPAAITEIRAYLESIGAGRPAHRDRPPVTDGELAHLTPAERRAELQRRYHPPQGDDAA